MAEAKTRRLSDWGKALGLDPPRDDVIDGILPQGEVMLICGDPWKGKSLEVQRLACQFPVGGSYHGLSLKQCDALYLTWEGSEKNLYLRFQKISNDSEKEPLIRKCSDPMYLDTTEGFKSFASVLAEAQELSGNLGVVIVDSFTYTIRGDYKNDVVVNQWWTAVQKLARRFKVTFIFVWEFVKPMVFRGQDVNAYSLARLKSAATTAYKVNTVICMGENEKRVRKGTELEWVKSPLIVAMKVKDGSKPPDLHVTLDTKTLAYVGEHWVRDPITDEFVVGQDKKAE